MEKLKLLSELCGIHAGDGYLRNDGKRAELDISGNVEEKRYYQYYVSHLILKIFGIKQNTRYFRSRNTYGLVLRDKKVIEFFHHLGFPYGKKSTIVKIPKFIKKKNFMGFILERIF